MERIATQRQRLLQTFGRFHVRYQQETVSFDILEEAYAFFKQLDTQAALWDVSDTPYIIVTREATIEI